MPRRSLFTDPERDTLLALPKDQDSLIRFYTFSESDLAIIKQHRGDANRLGFAVQLCYARYPGMTLPVEGEPGVTTENGINSTFSKNKRIIPESCETIHTIH